MTQIARGTVAGKPRLLPSYALRHSEPLPAPTGPMWHLLAQAQRHGLPLADLDPEQRRAIGVAIDRGEAQLRLIGGRACLCRSAGR